MVAVVQRAATVHVGAGENSGRTLQHTNIVRSFREAPLRAASGDETLSIPWDPKGDEADVAVLVQRASGVDAPAVLGAALAVVPPLPGARRP